MLRRIAIKIISFLLGNKELSLEDRSLLTSLVLDKLQALTLKNIITISEDGSVIVNGKTLTSEHKILLRESARGALNNQALNLIHDQVEYTAITNGIHKANNSQQLLFSQSAIWYGQQEREWLKILAKFPDVNEMEQELNLN